MPQKRKKILILNYEFPPIGGGASYASHDLALRLSLDKAYSIDVVTMGFSGLPAYEQINDHFRIHRVKCIRSKKEICHPWEQLSYLLSAYRKCVLLLANGNFELCHCHFIVPTGLLALKLKQKFGLNYILTSHGSDVLGYNKRFRFFYPLVADRWKKVLANASAVITASHYLKNRILEVCPQLPDNKISVIPNFARVTDIKPLQKKKTILIVSRLTKNKGVQDVLAAIKDMDLNHWQVKIVGDGPYKASLLDTTKKLGLSSRVNFLGWVENGSSKMKQIYGHASIFIMPSHFENMSLTLLEAMQAGCAIIATKVGGNPEVLGKSALFYPAGDSKLLGVNILSLTQSPRLEQMQKKSFSRLKTFDRSIVLAEYDKLISYHIYKDVKVSQIKDRPIVSICFISRSAYPLFNPKCGTTFGGAEVDSYLLATELAKDKKFQIKFIVGDFGQRKREYIQNVEIIRGYHFGETRPVQLFKLIRRIVQTDCDWYFQESASGGAGVIQLLCRLMGKRFLYRTASDIDCNGQYINSHPLEGRIYSYGIRNAERVITQNTESQRELREHFDISSLVIKNAYNMPSDISKNRRYILWVARSETIKQPEIYLDLVRRYPEQNFVMICPRANFNSVDYDALKKEAKNLPNLSFLPGVKFREINSYFSSAKLFINTSAYEGFPNTFVQAAMYGVPICSLNVNPDGFITREMCGIHAAGDLHKLEAGITEILKNARKYQEMRNNGLDYARSNHDISKIIKQYKSIFWEIEK